MNCEECGREIDLKQVAELAYDLQKPVSHFATIKECIAHNQALRDFAEHLLCKAEVAE